MFVGGVLVREGGYIRAARLPSSTAGVHVESETSMGAF